MFCEKCGKPISGRMNNCPFCGARLPNQDTKPPSRRKRTAVVIAVSAAAVLLLAVFGYFIFYANYSHTDAYKTGQAEKLLLDGKYDEAREQISGIDNSSADAMRRYADFISERSEFKALYNPDKLYTSKEDSEAVNDLYTSLQKSLNDFTDDENLPRSLQERLKTYRSRLKVFFNCFSGWELKDLSTAQTCLVDFVSRKHGMRFTIFDLSKSINTSDYALDRILTNLVETEAYSDFAQHSKSCAVQALTDLQQSVQNQLKQDRGDLTEYEKSFTKTKILYFDTIDKSYKADVGTLLPRLASRQDADDNATKIYTSLLYAWMAYVFDIQ